MAAASICRRGGSTDAVWRRPPDPDIPTVHYNFASPRSPGFSRPCPDLARALMSAIVTSDRRYLPPSVFDRVFNGLARALTGLGVSLYGSRNLAVRGRRSGEWRIVPVNLLEC